ncbi:ClC family H(+)/Cl(-) exchange transporter [Clostridium tyrobutyricum]|uniref:ClC family H(+)/Cl(-) exchange transporter n=1 Tax=Clostridium tyrobutyricum TaxID=1519 RepID=UPI002B1FCB9E|nr:ClC family H(+)/Cl(-) exchange transporter [Clostridium tyrobutyricum]MEA5009497.1 ClC family H(+)/Cl(-) exchange transporter [Clostridium tyrobutyricum]
MKNYEKLLNWRNFKIRLIFEGIIVGLFVGIVISLFRFLVGKSEMYLNEIYMMLSLNHGLIPIWIVLIAFLGYLIGLLIKRQPIIIGSGIPQVEGVILRKLHMNWYKVAAGKFIGSLVSIGSGLSMGIEGPSVQIGAALGQGIGTLMKRTKIEIKYLVTSGVSAGISTAFNAPVAGTMFALEEVHKNFSPIVLVSALSSALSSDFISREFFGMKPVFNFKNIVVLPLGYYPFIIILGIIIGAAGVGFSKVLLRSQAIYSKVGIKLELRPIIPFLISVAVAFFLPQALGEGNTLIMLLTKTNWTFKILVVILLVKFIFTMISTGSGAPGGIFLPLFAVGAIIGCIYGNVLVYFLNFKSIYIGSFVILAMAGYFSSVVKSPITGTILVVEMTGSFNNLLPCAIMSITAYLISDILNSKPIYQELLDRLLNNNFKYQKRI